jgi:23S rRNA (cytidine1920-2'-O)/16S rRNA (cytidine1409-2'-O)-methyltransferase
VLALVKPQFEVGPTALGRNGIVQKESDRLKALETVKKTALTLGYTIQGTIDSPISGGDGNREFLIYLT